MKPDVHPEYRLVVFRDTSAEVDHLIRSTAPTDRTCEIEGATYPLVVVDVSSASHPFFTGKMKIVDTAGRVERFNKRYGDRGARQR